MLELVKHARAAFSLVSPEEVRRRSQEPVRFGLVAADAAAYSQMEDFLIPTDTPAAELADLRGMVHRAADPVPSPDVDVVLYQDGIPNPEGTYSFHRLAPELTAREIAHAMDDIALPLARRYPVFRKPVVERMINAVARENALFAVATALPDVMPSLLELPWTFGEFASDTAFMTANQVRMAFLIAGACGKEVGFAHQKTEIAGIVAGAFGWRAIARELAGKIPFGGGLIPKGAIAYAVTYSIGKALQHMHHAGEPLTKEQHAQVYREAYEHGRSIAQSIVAAPPPAE